jgi:hypothetical protein
MLLSARTEERHAASFAEWRLGTFYDRLPASTSLAGPMQYFRSRAAVHRQHPARPQSLLDRQTLTIMSDFLPLCITLDSFSSLSPSATVPVPELLLPLPYDGRPPARLNSSSPMCQKCPT